MNYQILKSTDIPDKTKKHQLILRSFIAENDYMYFQTILVIEETNGIMLESTPTFSWKIAKKEYREILKKIGELPFLELSPHQVYLLNKKNEV